MLLVESETAKPVKIIWDIILGFYFFERKFDKFSMSF